MFEKNEDYRKARKESKNKITKVIKVWGPREEALHHVIFQDGTEFGYNKAKEDADIMKSRFLELCNLKDMRIAELEKANEWHYVKDGDLPKRENLECLCIIRPMKEEDTPFENKDFRGVLYYRNERFYLEENDSDGYIRERNSDFTDLVIAWKEIVLPKEVKK